MLVYYSSSLYTEVGTCWSTKMLVYLCPHSVSVSFCESVCPIHFDPAFSIVQALKHETLTQFWADVGPPSLTLSQN